MRILLIGNTGQVGWELQRTLAPLGDVLALDYPQIDLSNEKQTRILVRETLPHAIINAAAYTAVDRAEEDYDKALAINATGPQILAEEAKQLGACLFHYSTDFVYDGKKDVPYIETDTPAPLSAYGETKLLGDQAIEAVGGAHVIFRTAWVYSTRRPSFVTKVLGWARKFPELRIVTDQVGSPTSARMLAEVTAQVLAMSRGDNNWLAERAGVYHLGGLGGCSRYEWAQAILAHDPHADEQIAKVIHPALTAEFPTPAERPAYSILNCDKLADTFSIRLPDWETNLQLAMGL
jgi:dTDP-4-dehydrorhamnose reductase